MPFVASRPAEDVPDSGPLTGLVVADFSRVLAGPLATMTLADLGARVIKIERPGTGDDTRQWGPPFADDGMATYFQGVNRNKESIALDLADADDRATALALVRRADIVVDNFLPGALERFGLDYATISAEHPGVIYASISGFGSDAGRTRPGYDFVVQALGGLMHVTGEAHGAAMKVGVALVDVLAAKDLTIGILAALEHRRQSGRGRRVEANLLSSLQTALANQAQAVVGAGVEPGRLGNRHPSICPYESVACAEGELALAVGNDRQFRALVTALERPELADEPRFATNPDRVRNRDALIPLLEQGLAADSAGAWAERLTAVGVPAGGVNTIGAGIELAASLGIDPVIELERDGVRSRGIRHPLRYSPDFDMPRQGPPPLNGDGARVRAWLGDDPGTVADA